MGLCASYAALARFISGQDLYIPPRSPRELLNTLRSYSFDALHNLISHSRTAMQPGGYSRVRCRGLSPPSDTDRAQACEIASTSLSTVVAAPEHTTYLLELHRRPIDPGVAGGTDDLHCPVASPLRPLRT